MCQLVVSDLGREAPTVILTNDRAASAKQLIERHARLMKSNNAVAKAGQGAQRPSEAWPLAVTR
ncbi:MAG: hypothetical protein ACRDZW_06975 [Acidimicrobiales bacterium]